MNCVYSKQCAAGQVLTVFLAYTRVAAGRSRGLAGVGTCRAVSVLGFKRSWCFGTRAPNAVLSGWNVGINGSSGSWAMDLWHKLTRRRSWAAANGAVHFPYCLLASYSPM